MIAPVVLPGANQSIDVFQRDFIASAKLFRQARPVRRHLPGIAPAIISNATVLAEGMAWQRL